MALLPVPLPLEINKEIRGLCMTRLNRHIRTLPDGRLAITQVNCEDGDPSEETRCKKAQFELGRKELVKPLSGPGSTTIRNLGSSWRFAVHYLDWVKWELPMPLGPCRIISVHDLPASREYRNNWQDTGLAIVEGV